MSVLRRLKLGLIIVPLAILAWVVVAVVLGSGTFSGARSAVGMAALPNQIAVEVEMVLQVSA